LGPVRLAVLVEPVGVDKAIAVVVGLIEDGLQERGMVLHGCSPGSSVPDAQTSRLWTTLTGAHSTKTGLDTTGDAWHRVAAFRCGTRDAWSRRGLRRRGESPCLGR